VSTAPDYVEPIVAWRLWYAVEDDDYTLLSSIIHRTLWPHRQPLVAMCRCFRPPFWPFNRRLHQAPAAGCKCGIYAASAATVRTYLPEQFALTGALPVIGRVSLWGVVHECERGWRASHAYPERLFVPIVDLESERAARIIDDLRAYGVPVRAIDGATADAAVDQVCAFAA
jgi:hypothetical protein